MRLLGARMSIARDDLGVLLRPAEGEPSLPPAGIDWAGGSMGATSRSSRWRLLDGWSAAYPSICTPKFPVGQSIEGRDIWAIKVSDNPTVDEDERVRIDRCTMPASPSACTRPRFLDGCWRTTAPTRSRPTS
jgi:hypothetical protein